jgi:hypothetical protein
MPEEKSEHEIAVDLIARFGACERWPRNNDTALSFLAERLIQAASRFKVTMESIADRWAENNRECPTEFDLLQSAQAVRDDLDRAIEAHRLTTQHQEWEKTYGPPDPIEIDWDLSKPSRYDQCWAQIKQKYPKAIPDWPRDTRDPNFRELARYAREFGYIDIAEAWERS